MWLPIWSQSNEIQLLDRWAYDAYSTYLTTGRWNQNEVDSVIFLYPTDTVSSGKEKLYTIIATHYHSRGKYEISLPYFLEVERGLRKRQDSVQWAFVLGRIGEEYRGFEELVKADSVLRKGLEIALATGDSQTIAYVSGRFGGTIYQIDRHDTSCLKHYRRSIKYYELLGNKEEFGAHIAEIATVLGQNRMEREAIKMLNRVSEEGLSGLTQTRLVFSKAFAYYKSGVFDSSIYYADSSLYLGMKEDLKLYSFRSAKIKQKSLDSLGRMEEAYEWSIRSRSLQRSYLQSERGDDLRLVRLEHERQNEASENQRLRSEKRMQEAETQLFKRFIVFGLVLLAVLIITVLLLLRNRVRLKNVQQSLMGVNKEIDKKNQELEDYVDLRDRMISVISHDLRSPMASLINMLEILKDPDTTLEEIRDLLPLLEGQMKNSIDFADNLIVWVKSQLNGTEAFPVKVDLFALSQEVAELARPVWEGAGIDVRVSQKGNASALADIEMTKFIVRNVLSNAIKFSLSDTVIEISIKSAQEKVVLVIKDQGKGMNSVQLENLFTIGERKGAGLAKGAGIGLYLSHYFALMMKGTLKAKSNEEGEKGSRFILELPSHA